eukprot:9473863-Pyramimonas_sp.AAC.5
MNYHNSECTCGLNTLYLLVDKTMRCRLAVCAVDSARALGIVSAGGIWRRICCDVCPFKSLFNLYEIVSTGGIRESYDVKGATAMSRDV